MARPSVTSQAPPLTINTGVSGAAFPHSLAQLSAAVLPSISFSFPGCRLLRSPHPSRSAALRCDEAESSLPAPRSSRLSSFFSSPPLAPLPFLPFGCRRRCCSAGVGAARFPPRRPRSLWPRPPWVFLLKVTTSLFKNSAEKEKTLYPTLWAVISREYRTVGGREAGRVGPRRLPAVPSSSPPPAVPAPQPAASNMAAGGVCGGGPGRAPAVGPGTWRPWAAAGSRRGWARGRVRVGPALGEGSQSAPGGMRAPTPFPWCIAVSGEGAQRRSPEGSGSRRFPTSPSGSPRPPRGP